MQDLEPNKMNPAFGDILLEQIGYDREKMVYQVRQINSCDSELSEEEQKKIKDIFYSCFYMSEETKGAILKNAKIARFMDLEHEVDLIKMKKSKQPAAARKIILDFWNKFFEGRYFDNDIKDML